MSERASEWGFIKLLLSLDTGLAGLLIYGQEHIIKYRWSKIALATSVLLLLASLFYCVAAATLMLDLDPMRDEVDSMRQHYPNASMPSDMEGRFDTLWRSSRKGIRDATWLFAGGVFFAVVFVMWNLPG
jgi:hypothetical protein